MDLPTGYSAMFAAFFDADTYEWELSKCHDDTCPWCKSRPDTAKGLENDIDKLVLQDHVESRAIQ